uniref:Uncharacterized protein n=1 Tax=Setaria italica TaxID=4555 RepID=A0A0Q3QYQ0_SETIT
MVFTPPIYPFVHA